jgi:hypothetical protein
MIDLDIRDKISQITSILKVKAKEAQVQLIRVSIAGMIFSLGTRSADCCAKRKAA